MQRLSFSLILTLIVSVNTSASASLRSNQPATSQTQASDLVLKASASQFVGVQHPTSGQAQIVEEGGAKYLELSQDFQSDRGPDLKVILHKASTVNQKVQEGDYVNLGLLKSFNGSQRYLIPDEVDLTQYQSVAIWCEEYNVTFGYAPMAQ